MTDVIRQALEAIANSEIPGVSGGPHGPSLQVMEFAQRALRLADGEPSRDAETFIGDSHAGRAR